MADLNVALILRLVDRLSAPARAAGAALGALSRTQGAASKAATSASRAGAAASDVATRAARASGAAVTGAAAAARGYTVTLGAATSATKGAGAAMEGAAAEGRTYGVAMQLAATASAGLDQAVRVTTDSLGRAGDASRETSAVTRDLAESEETAGRSAEAGARKFSILERAQRRGLAATRMLRGEVDKFDKALGRLAMASLAVEGMAPLAHGLSHLVGHSVGDAAAFQSGMTGFGITAELSDAQMAPIKAAIQEASIKYGLKPEEALETFAFTRRSGVFTKPAEIVDAGGEAAKFQKLAGKMGSPVSGEEVAGGAGSAVREYGFAANAEGIRRYYAMIDAAEKAGGGMTMDALLQYSRSAGGQMKAFGAGSAAGLADVLAAQQVSMYLSHTPGQAGINVQDLLANISHKMTVRRFAKQGVNLPAYMQAMWKSGESPLQAFTELVMKMTAGKTGPARRFAVGELMNNQQAGQSLMALAQNMPAFLAKRNQIIRPQAVGVYEDDVYHATHDSQSRFQSLGAAIDNMKISMGDILLPVASRLADVLASVAKWMKDIAAGGGLFARISAFSIAGLAGVMTAAVGLGHLFVGVAAPFLTARFLLSKGAPLAGVAARGGLAGMAMRAGGLLRGGLGLATDVALAGPRLAWRAGGAAMRAPAAMAGAFRAARVAALSFGRGAIGAVSGVIGMVGRFSVAGLVGGFRGAAAAVIGFARSGRLAALAMDVFKFAARGALAATGVGLLILLAVLIVQHWRGVVTFFQGFGRGFMKALAPIRPALQPLISVISGVVGWVSKLFGGGKGEPGDDWSSFGEKVGAAIGGVVVQIATLIGWLGTAITVAGQFWDRITGKGASISAAVALSAAAAHAAPASTPAQAAAAIAAPAAAKAPAARSGPAPRSSPRTLRVEQHFHGPYTAGHGDKVDHRKLAREMQRHAARHIDSALHDGGDDL